MAIPSPTVRGVVVLGTLDWVRHTHGERSLERVLADVAEPGRTLLTGRSLIQTTRVPARTFRQLSDGIIEAHGLQGETGFHAAAASVAEADLSGYMRMLVSIGSPKFVVGRFPRVWKHYFDTGQLVVTPVESGADVQVSGAAEYGAAALEGAVGWMRAALRISRAKGPQVSRLGTGSAPAQYRVRWQ
ncbi:MAG: DUF2378 family protein [Myxococcota bacterium]